MNLETSPEKIYNISIEALKEKDILCFVTLVWDSFPEKMMPLFSNNRQAGIEILAREARNSLQSGAYFVAKAKEMVVGAALFKTVEIARKSRPREPGLYLRKLGFFKGLKALAIISFENLFRVRKKEFCIDILAVKQGYRGKGIGKKLLAFAENYARKEGKAYLELGVVEKNKPALNLYYGFGFEKSRQYSMWISEKISGYRVWYIMKKKIQ